MSLISSAQSLALKGTPRLLFLGAGVAGLGMVAELAFRGCRETASTVVPDRVKKWGNENLPKWFTGMPRKLSDYKFVKGLRSFSGWQMRDLAKWAMVNLTVSAFGLAAMEALPFVGKPHDIYNKVLNNISYIQLRETGSPFMTMRETMGQIKTRLFG